MVTRLYRPKMVAWLESYRDAHPDAPFCPFAIGAYKRLNPDFTKLLNKNFSQLEAIAGYTGTFLLIDNRRGTTLVPDRNLTYYFIAIRKSWNDRARNTVAQLRSNPYDFETVKRPTKMSPDGNISTITYRFLEPERGDDAVDLSQTDLDNSISGMRKRSSALDECRDIQAVDIRIEEIIKEYNL